QSEVGKGSIFILRLPQRYAGPAVVDRATLTGTQPGGPQLLQPEPPPGTASLLGGLQLPRAPAPATELRPAQIEDDRARLTADARIILIVEDDLSFAAILRDLARELGFLCVATQTAADALAAVQRFKVHAIILDMNLPDRSGLEVLNELKRNLGTRHI